MKFHELSTVIKLFMGFCDSTMAWHPGKACAAMVAIYMANLTHNQVLNAIPLCASYQNLSNYINSPNIQAFWGEPQTSSQRRN